MTDTTHLSAALQKAQAAKKAKKEAGEETIRLTPMEAHQADPLSKAKAIKAKCYECMGGDCEGVNWRREIKLCSATECPLFPVRPYK